MPLVIASPGIGDLRQVCLHLSHLLIEAGVRFVSMDLGGKVESSISWVDYSDVSIASDYLALVEKLNSSPAVHIGNSKPLPLWILPPRKILIGFQGSSALGHFQGGAIKWW